MGGHMAHNLLKAKHEVVVFDVAQSAVDKAVAQGASSAATPRELAAEGCDTIVTMLPSNPHVVSVYTDPETGILASVKKGALLIDSSTIDPNVSRQVAAEAEKAGATMVDAPVSGVYHSRVTGCGPSPVNENGFTPSLRAELYDQSRRWLNLSA